MNDVLSRIADLLLARRFDGVLRVAVDGVDGVGKTTFADGLATHLRARGREVVRASVDGFHHPRAHRYRLGRASPEGFYRDSYDYQTLKALLLEPLGPGGSRLYRTAAFDHLTDRPVEPPTRMARDGAILIFDGIFLQRQELRSFWDLTIFLDAPFEVTIPRGAARGPGYGSPDSDAPSNRRYIEGQRLYLAEARPRETADVVVDCTDVSRPKLTRGGGPQARP